MKADLPAALEGTWQVSRVIWHADDSRARLTGQAVWTPEGAGWREVETGTLEQGDLALEARRETLWHPTPEGVAVAFGDGRPFHVIGPGSRPTAMHDCPPDDYHLAYDFSAWPRWSVRWRVTGPRKDYRAITRYRRP